MSKLFLVAIAGLILTVKMTAAANLTNDQIIVFENIALAKITTKHCPDYEVNPAMVLKELHRVGLRDSDFRGEKFDIAMSRAEKAFVGLRLKYFNEVCHYIYTKFGDYSDYPILQDQLGR